MNQLSVKARKNLRMKRPTRLKNLPRPLNSGKNSVQRNRGIKFFSIASLLGMGSSTESLTPNLVFNPTTAAATLNQMRLFQVTPKFLQVLFS